MPVPDSRLTAPLRGSSGCLVYYYYYYYHIQEGPCSPTRIRTDTVEGGGEGAPPPSHSPLPCSYSSGYDCVLSHQLRPAIFLPLPFQRPPSPRLPDMATAEAHILIHTACCPWLPLGGLRTAHVPSGAGLGPDTCMVPAEGSPRDSWDWEQLSEEVSQWCLSQKLHEAWGWGTHGQEHGGPSSGSKPQGVCTWAALGRGRDGGHVEGLGDPCLVAR